MKITGIQYRNFYPQKSLNFDFKVYNYSSDHFEVGITGTHYVRYLFKSGIIKDPNDNIIGTFNKEPISINSYIKEPFSEGSYVQGYTTYKDYLNSVPITREGVLATPTSIFSALVVKILDSPVSNSVDLDAFIYGSSIPKLEFSNFYSNEAVSGKITNKGQYIVDIFSINSSSITGKFTHVKEIQPGNYINFFNYDTSGYSQGFPVYLDLETNFGNQSYSLQIQNAQTVNEDAQEDDTDDIVFERITWSNISAYSGDIIQTGISKAIFELEYLLQVEGSKIDLDFQYTEGKTGDLTITGSSTDFFGSENINVSYSGTLFTQNGISNGLLYNTDFEKTKDDYTIKGNIQDVKFYSLEGQLSREFTNLKATGEVVYIVQPNDGLPINTKINDLNLNPDYFIDLGGKTGLPNTFENYELNYERLNTYKAIAIPNNFTPFPITGIVDKEEMEGKFVFEKHKFIFPSSVLLHTKNLPTSITNTQIGNIYPYRGVSYATLNDQYILFSSEAKGETRPFIFLTSDSDTLFFKNLSNIDYNGQYRLSSQDLVKTRVLNSNTYYFKNNGGFSDSLEYKGKEFINSIIKDGIITYQNLTPFDNVEDVYNDFYKREDNQDIKKLDYGINWNENNLLVLKKEDNTSCFYSDSDSINFGITFDDKEFLSDRSTSKSANLIKSTQSENFTVDSLSTNVKIDDIANPNFVSYGTLANTATNEYKINFNFTKKDSTKEDYTFSFYILPQDPLPAETGVPFIQIFCGESFYCNINSLGAVLTDKSVQAGSYDTDKEGAFYPQNIKRVFVKFKILNEENINIKLVNASDSSISQDGFNPQSNIWKVNIFGVQLEEENLSTFLTPTPYQLYSEGTLLEGVFSGLFQYFIYKLYGIPGQFSTITSQGNNNYRVFTTTNPLIRDEKRNSCGDIKCFSTFFEENNKATLWDKNIIGGSNSKYKGISESNSNIVSFFTKEILPYLFNIKNNNFPKLYTDFDKLYFEATKYASNGTVLETKNTFYLKNNNTYSYAVNEIIDLFIKHKNYDYSYVSLEGVIYKIPKSYGTNKLTPIPNNELDNIVFSGFLNKSLDLNIQAGFCRYYLTENVGSQNFGYFYETPNFYDVKNTNLINTQNTFVDLFPEEKSKINERPFKESMSLINISFSRLVKSNIPKELEKTINSTVYVQSCYFKKQFANSILDLTGTFYNIKKRMNQVWSVKIKNSIDDEIPVYEFRGPTPLDFDKYEIKGFATQISLDSQKRYLEITHDDIEEITFNENDQALITLTAYSFNNDPSPVVSSFSIP
jgi:hypothetical protein